MALPRRDRIIVALDTNNIDTCKKIIDQLKGRIKIFKVGKELFTACGNEAVSLIHASGAHCFLDLKFHDIPNTVAKASSVVCQKKIMMFNVHASGGMKMMQAAYESSCAIAHKQNISKPIILAVTMLTSIGDDEAYNEVGICRSLREQVLSLAKIAKRAGLDGVVASAKEVELIKRTLGDDFLVVTPGIRPRWAAPNDQTRIVTPSEAFRAGADYIVIGRPITMAENPIDAVEKIIKEVEADENEK